MSGRGQSENAEYRRVYDYFVGGRNNFVVDRELAERLIDAFPPLLPTVVENREFLSRAVAWAASQGVSQFIDLGCGMPTSPNTHETAQTVLPDALVTYVDNDPIVLSHLDELLVTGNPGVAKYVEALAPGSYVVLTTGLAPVSRRTGSSAFTWPMARRSFTSTPRQISRRSSDRWRWCHLAWAMPGQRGPVSPRCRIPRNATQ